MARNDGISTPVTAEDAVRQAVKAMLRSAALLITAADLAKDAETVQAFINSAIRLRDLANSLSPDKPDWPVNVIPFVPKRNA